MAPGTAISAAHSSGTAPKPISANGGGRENAGHVGCGGEQDATMSSSVKLVALHEVRQQLLGALRHLLDGVDVDRGGPAQAPDHDCLRTWALMLTGADPTP